MANEAFPVVMLVLLKDIRHIALLKGKPYAGLRVYVDLEDTKKHHLHSGKLDGSSNYVTISCCSLGMSFNL